MPQDPLQYFIENQADLVKKYKGRFIVIKDNAVVGVYDRINDAYDESVTKYEPGTFFIQQCIPGENAYSQTFNSRVIFA